MKAFTEFLQSEAGYITVALLLIAIGYLLFRAGYPKSEDVVPFALGVLARSMGGTKQP